jgi:cytochrome bd ubiquinol oxidase subunit II
MSGVLPLVTAGILLVAITAYSTAGGVDFGAGIWDLLAGTGQRAHDVRELIDRAMAPVWEVNNVWLVLGIVVCWTGFPALFQAVFLSLYPLYALALLGLILRGSFFAFRHVTDEPRERRFADRVFGASSVLTPFFFAASLGAIASGRVHVDGPEASAWQAGFSPMSVAFGVVALAATATSGAAFLVGDARRERRPDLVEYFRLRTLAATAALIVVGTVALATVAVQAPSLLRAMFAPPAIVFTAAAMLLTPAVGLLLWRRVYRWYRVATVAAVGSLVVAWGVAQSPYLLPGRLTIRQAAAPSSTQVLLLVCALVVVLVIGPAMALLYYLDQRTGLQSPDPGLHQQP